MNDDEGFISEESDQNNYQLKLPKEIFIDDSINTQIPLHNIEHKCVFLKHKQTSSYNFKYHFNGLLLDDYQLSKQQPIINNGMFNSDFESANLYAAYEIKDNQFNLILQDDTNTIGYSQWFYFEVNNLQGSTLTFHIINLIKEYKSLKHGLSVMIKETSQQWQPLETHVKLKTSQYYKLKYPTQMCKLYQLSIIIPSKHKQFKLSLNYPYTNQDLYSFLKNEYQIFTNTLSGMKVPILRYGSTNNDVIVVIARQHPGETVSSYVCQGFLTALQQDNLLTQQFHFIILPLFNPDGVEQGNFRCDLSGKDLNRSWHKPNPNQKSIKKHYTNKKYSLLYRFAWPFQKVYNYKIRLNSFMYACRGGQDPVQCRILPQIFSKTSKYFDFHSCTFSLEPYKLKTARAFVFKLVKKYYPSEVHDIFTLETSFFGYNDFYQIKQFTQCDLLQIGQDLYKSLVLYYTNFTYKQQIAIELEKYREQFHHQDLYTTEDQSDSDPENGMIIQKQPKKYKRFDKKVSIKKEISFIKKYQQPQLSSVNNNNYDNFRYFSMPKSKIEQRQMKSQSFHQQINTTQSQLKDLSADITPTNKFKLKTQQSNNNQEIEQSQNQILISQQKRQNFQFQKTNIVPPIHNGLSIKVVQNKPKNELSFQQQHQPIQQSIRINQSFQSTQYNSPENKNLVIMSKSIQKKDTWDPRLIFEFTQKVKRKNTQSKII